jgi:hypothetical protein
VSPFDPAALTAPFRLTEVKFKPQSVKGNRALAMAYIDCRVIQDRLDAVLGVENWQDEYHIVPDGSVICQLRLRINGEWVTKTDVGSPSEQPDGGDRLKAAFSDALKRAAVKFGIGRYLYRLPAVWCDYDPQKKQFSQRPQLPAWAVPKGEQQQAQARPQPQQQQQQPQAQHPRQQKPAEPVPPASVAELVKKMELGTPATGTALVQWVVKADQELARLEPRMHKGNALCERVADFMKAGAIADLAALEHEQDISAAWNNAKIYVRDLAGRTQNQLPQRPAR